MKSILVFVLLFTTCSFAFGQPAATQKSNDEKAIRQLLDELYAALGRNNTSALDRIYADDYTLVDERGVVNTKAQRLASIKSGELKYESVSFDDMNIRLYGSTAVAVYRANNKAQFKGQEVGGQFRVTVTLIKTKGRWRVAAAQVTRIAG